MSDEFVNRFEFDALKDEVNAIKKEMAESNKILQAIDKKIDIINEKIVSSDKIDELKLAPIEKRVDDLEDAQKWLRKTIIGALVAVAIEAIVFVIKMMV